MRLLVVFLAIAVLLPSAAFAQVGTVALFADPAGIDCNVWDIPGILNIYVVYIWHGGAAGVEFSAPQPACAIGLVWLSDIPVFPVTIGNSQMGVAIGFGACYAAPTHVLTIQYFAQGITPPCCRYEVRPDPGVPSGQIEAYNCVPELVYPTPGRAFINPDPSCMCNSPVPVEETSWGQIKALYQ